MERQLLVRRESVWLSLLIDKRRVYFEAIMKNEVSLLTEKEKLEE